ncbi:PF20097 family protein [Clostridium sp.]|uniref:PF20097 family protein n=1 Tax=Clostridium sp. TaxID=1506 RepID=UPI002FCBA333
MSKDSFRKLKNVNCPSCGIEMEKGYIYSPAEISWSKDGKPRFFPGLAEYDTLVDANFGLKVRKEEAFRCKECNLVLFEYNPKL